MADHNVPGAGVIPATLTILLGIWSNVSASDLAAFISISVGCYTLFINYPKFKKRVQNIIESYKKKK